MKVQILLILLLGQAFTENVEIVDGPPELSALENDKLLSCAEIIGVRLRNDQVI
jgi:hypothetical protein